MDKPQQVVLQQLGHGEVAYGCRKALNERQKSCIICRFFSKKKNENNERRF